MSKASREMRLLRSATEDALPGHNHLPTPGVAYGEGIVGQHVMFASADGIGIWVEIEYLDEQGQTQKRMLGKGIWPIRTTQINGYRPHGDKAGSLIAEVTTDNFEITVLW